MLLLVLLIELELFYKVKSSMIKTIIGSFTCILQLLRKKYDKNINKRKLRTLNHKMLISTFSRVGVHLQADK